MFKSSILALFVLVGGLAFSVRAAPLEVYGGLPNIETASISPTDGIWLLSSRTGKAAKLF